MKRGAVSCLSPQGAGGNSPAHMGLQDIALNFCARTWRMDGFILNWGIKRGWMLTLPPLKTYILKQRNRQTLSVQPRHVQDNYTFPRISVCWTDSVCFPGNGHKWNRFTRPVQKVPSHVLWNTESFTEEDTRYKKHCTQDNDTWILFKVGTLVSHIVPPIAISCYITFSWISMMVLNLFPFKGDFTFGKSQTLQGAKSGL